jgi:hypothetical protein
MSLGSCISESKQTVTENGFDQQGCLSALAAYASDSREAERLKYLSSQEGKVCFP